MKKHASLFILLFSLLVIVSCTKKSDDVNMQPATAEIVFNFSHFVGSQPLQFNTMAYTNAYGNTYSVETLKYFISDIVLHTSDGGIVAFDEAHYVDGKDLSTVAYAATASAPTGEYAMISFIFGLDEEKNVPGEFPNPPENNMEWPPAMGSGYHYMKLEGKYDSTDLVKNYQAHTGPTMNNQNYFQVQLPNSGFIAAGGVVTVDIGMNINNWWVSPHTLDLNDMTMIMGNQDMQIKLRDNGLEDVFSIVSIE